MHVEIADDGRFMKQKVVMIQNSIRGLLILSVHVRMEDDNIYADQSQVFGEKFLYREKQEKTVSNIMNISYCWLIAVRSGLRDS